MSSEGEDELRTEGTLPKSRVEASNAGGSVDDATQVVRLSDSAAADSADQLKTLLQSAEVPSAGFEPAELVGLAVIDWIAFWVRGHLVGCIWGMTRSCVERWR